jgi:BMFP domain-containing protein YqiC
MTFVRVTGTNYVRDTKGMVLNNTDDVSRNEYYAKVQMLKNQKQEINTLKSEMESIKGDVSEIKQMMLKLMEKVN